MYTVLYILITVQYVHSKHTSELRVSITYRLQIESVHVFRKWDSIYHGSRNWVEIVKTEIWICRGCKFICLNNLLIFQISLNISRESSIDKNLIFLFHTFPPGYVNSLVHSLSPRYDFLPKFRLPGVCYLPSGNKHRNWHIYSLFQLQVKRKPAIFGVIENANNRLRRVIICLSTVFTNSKF